MGVTKIKSHRINEKSIEEKHLSDNLKFNEGERVVLKYPSHDNSADLSVEQKNILTQMGNADNLHFHTGGGGGPQGIYTNEERDSQLLKLNLMINSSIHGISKSVTDDLKDDSTIDYGIRERTTPNLSLYNDDINITGTLEANKSYSYFIEYFNKYGSTGIGPASSITTSGGNYNAVKVLFRDVPNDNLGYAVYRAYGNTSVLITEFDRKDNFTNLGRDKFFIDYKDNTSGSGSLNIDIRGLNRDNVAVNELDSYRSFGETYRGTIDKATPFEYIIFANSLGNIFDSLHVIWGPAENLIPEDYELYYTVDSSSITALNDNMEWRELDCIYLHTDKDGVPLSATDGKVIGHKISGNTKSRNSFMLNTTLPLVGIKIKVTKVREKCRLYNLAAIKNDKFAYKSISCKLDNKIELKDYNSIEFDLKQNINDSVNQYINLTLLDSNTDDYTGTTIFDYTTSDTSYERVGNYSSFHSTNSNYSINKYIGCTKFKAYINAKPYEYIDFENVYLHVGYNYSNYSISNYCIDIPIKFNGSYSYTGYVPSNGLIESDLIDIDISRLEGFSSAYFSSSIFLKTGSILSTGAYTTYEATNGAYGLECQNIKNTSYNNTYSGTVISKLVLYKPNNNKEFNIKSNYYAPIDRWNKIIVPIPEEYKKYKYDTLITCVKNNYSVDGYIKIDNLKVTKTKLLNDLATCYASAGTTTSMPLLLTDSVDRPCYKSGYNASIARPQSIGVKFNTLTQLNEVKFMWCKDNNDSYAKVYGLQYSTFANADIDLPFNDPVWQNVTNLTIGDGDKYYKNAGYVQDNLVYNNDEFYSMMSHKFDTVSARCFRIISLESSGVIHYSKMAIYYRDNSDDFKMIYKSNKTIDKDFEFIDDGKVPTEISPNDINTTGSQGIYYDNSLKVIKLHKYNDTGVVYFNTIKMPLYKNVLMIAQYTGNIDFYVSNDDGLTFYKATLERVMSFENSSQMLTVKAVMYGNDTVLNAVSFLYSL